VAKSCCFNGIYEVDLVHQIISSVESWQLCLFYVQCTCCFASFSPGLCTIQNSGHFGWLSACAFKFPSKESRVHAQGSHPAVQPTCGRYIYTENRFLGHSKPLLHSGCTNSSF